MNADVQRYLQTLRRIPKPVVLAMATREFVMSDRQTCICGWAIREALARTAQAPAEDVPNPIGYDSPAKMAELFGGGRSEWSEIFTESVGDDGSIETAFTRRVAECVR